jgi:predicted lipoprotein
MKNVLLSAVIALIPTLGTANDVVVSGVIDDHILPRFATLVTTSDTLAMVAQQSCDALDQLRPAYGAAFDAWVSASHLRFGPTEMNDRAFAIAFWPDSRGKTPRALAALIAAQDPIVHDTDAYADVSIAARGFYALEFLLYDDTMMAQGDDAYRCQLIQAITVDIAKTTTAIAGDWRAGYAEKLRKPSVKETYHTSQEALQELFKALSTGLQFTSETRLGRPLGTFDKPRPTRAEAWRSGRSAHHVNQSLSALHDLAILLVGENTVLSAELTAAFEQAQSQLRALVDPTFSGVADTQKRFEIEVVQTSIETIRTLVRDQLGPQLGVAAGFNALDGD